MRIYDSLGIPKQGAVSTVGITGVSAGTTNVTTGQAIFSNSNGVSFGANGQTITASHNGLTSQSNQALSGSNGSFSFQTVTFGNLNGLSFYSSNGSMVGSYTVPTQSVQTQNLVTVLGSTGDISFNNANGITFGGNNSTITASHNGLTSQSNQAISGSNGSFAFQTVTFGNHNGLSFYTSNGSMVGSYTVPSVPAQTNQTLGLYGVSNTTLSSSGTVDARTISFQGAGIVSVGVSNGSVVISATGGGGGGLTNVNLSAGTTSQNLSNFVFSNSNGLTFGLNGSTITGSHNGITSQSVQTQNMVSVAASTGNVVFDAANGITFGGNNSTITASHNGLTSQSNQALSGSNGSFAFQTATFGNLNGFSFYTSNGSMVGSYTVPTQSVQTQNMVSVAGSTGNVLFNAANGITFGGNNSTITASHNGITSQSNQQISAFAVSNTTQSTSGTMNASNLSFHGAGIASVGVSNGSVIISVPAGGGAGDGYNILAAGTQTAGTNVSVVLSNSNRVSFGMSNSSVITGSVAEPTLFYYRNYEQGHLTRGQRATGFSARPFFLPFNIHGDGLIASRLRLSLERSAGNTLHMTYGAAIYTLANATSANLAASATNVISLTASAQWTGIRVLDVLGMSSYTVPAGPAIMGLFFQATSNSTVNMDFNFYGVSHPAIAGYLGSGTNNTSATASNSILYPFYGAFRTTSGGFPSVIASTDVIHNSTVPQAFAILGSNL